MFWWSTLFTFLCISLICVFKFYLRYVEFSDFLLCYACREMDNIYKPYDYIVIGAGSAGSVIANRLSEDKDVKVLVLEAGSYGDSLMQIPAVSPLLQQSTFDWKHRTTPQEHACMAMKNNKSAWPMGKIVGGTHQLNNMIYTRGHPSDYANWYENNRRYSYEKDVLPYFLKAEKYLADSYRSTSSVVVNEPTFTSNLTDYLLEAAKSLGFPIVEHYISTDTGFSKPKVTVLNGRRRTTLDQLLAHKRENVLVRAQTTVEKILFKNNYEAYAVRYLYLDERYYARATKGIILSAGVIGSPQILMLSGIGHNDHLRSLGIKRRVNLPVGDNLQDHVTTGLDLVILENFTLNFGMKSLLSPYGAYQYFVQGSGSWTSSGCDVLAFFDDDVLNCQYPNCSHKNFRFSKQMPELQFMVMPTGISTDNGVYLQALVNLRKKTWENYFQHLNTSTVISILPVILHPKSKGTVRLQNKSVKTKPLINPNYLAEQYDIDLLIKGINLIQRLLETEPMKKIGARLNTNVFPGCEAFEFNTKPYWKCYVRQLTLTSYHPVGTCKMGNDRTSVVGYDFKVRDTNKLYVVDASVIPSLISGNINGAIIMLAEKAAEGIKLELYLNTHHSSAKEIFLPKRNCDKLFPNKNFKNRPKYRMIF